jgi:hypothetical protein
LENSTGSFATRIRVFVLLVVSLVAPRIALAQDVQAASQQPPPVALEVRTPEANPVREPAAHPRGVLLPLYSGFATMEALDVHSSLRARAHGGVERNPLLAGVSNPVAFSLLKAGAAASTIYLIDRLHPHHRKAAIITMISIDVAYGIVVAHNYRMVH